MIASDNMACSLVWIIMVELNQVRVPCSLDAAAATDARDKVWNERRM